jgi:hypothetical protein
MELLLRLGYTTQEQAKEELKYIGRNGPMPWAALFFLQTMPYVNLSTFNLIPTAHNYLNGLVGSLLTYALLSKSVPDDPVRFSEAQKKSVKVSFIHSWAVFRRICVIYGQSHIHNIQSSFIITDTDFVVLGGLEVYRLSTCFCLSTSRSHQVLQQVQDGGESKSFVGGLRFG